MINSDDYVNENKTEHNPNWPHTLDCPYRILNSIKIIDFTKKSASH